MNKLSAILLAALSFSLSFAGSAGANEPIADEDSEAASSVELYRHVGFQDSLQKRQVSGCFNLPAGANDEASSARVSGSVDLYTDRNCTGRALHLTADADNLHAHGFGDVVSSVHVR